MRYIPQSESGMEAAIIALPVVAVIVLLFNACKTGRLGRRLCEGLNKLSTLAQSMILVAACLIVSILAIALYLMVVE